MSDTGATDASRARVAFLGAIILGESLQGPIAAKYGGRLVEFRALGAVRRAGLVPISPFAELIGIGRATARGNAALQDCVLLSDGTIGERIRTLSVVQQGQLADLCELVIAADPSTIAPSNPATTADAAS